MVTDRDALLTGCVKSIDLTLYDFYLVEEY